jgi:hypothetical protein
LKGERPVCWISLGWREGRTATTTEIRRQRASVTTGELPLEDQPSGNGEEIQQQRSLVLSRKNNEVFLFFIFYFYFLKKKNDVKMPHRLHLSL